MRKLLVLFALLAVGDAKFGSVVFDIFGNIYKVTLPQPGSTPVTLPASAGPKASQAAFKPLDFLNVLNPTASKTTPTPIIPNPLSFLDIFKHEVPTPGVSSTPDAILTISAYTTANLPGALSISTKSSDLPSVAPTASSTGPTAPVERTTISAGLVPTTYSESTTPKVPDTSTPSCNTSDVPSVSPPASPGLPTILPELGDRTTNLPATASTALPSTPDIPGTITSSIGSSDVPSVSSTVSPGITEVGDQSTKLPAPTALPTTPGLTGTSTPLISPSDVPSVSSPASTSTPKVPGIADLTSKSPVSITNTESTNPHLSGTSTPSIDSSNVPSVSTSESSGTPKSPGINDLTSKPPGSIPNTEPTTPDIPGTSTSSIGSADVPSVSTPASPDTPKIPGIGDLTSKPPGSITNTEPTTPDLSGTSTPSIGSSDIPSVSTPACSETPKVSGISDLTSKPPGSITNTEPTTPNLPGTLNQSIGSSDATSSSPGAPKTPGLSDPSSKLPDAAASKPTSLGGLPNSDSLNPAKGNGDLISDAIDLFSNAAKNPFGRK